MEVRYLCCTLQVFLNCPKQANTKTVAYLSTFNIIVIKGQKFPNLLFYRGFILMDSLLHCLHFIGTIYKIHFSKRIFRNFEIVESKNQFWTCCISGIGHHILIYIWCQTPEPNKWLPLFINLWQKILISCILNIL